MANDAEDYIAAVADACKAAGLHVGDYWSDDIDPRDGGIDLLLRPDADVDEDWRETRTLCWNEERGWFYGEPKNGGGELHNLRYIGDSALPDPALIAAEASMALNGQSVGQLDPVQWRDQEDDDGFEDQLAAYRGAATGQESGW